jgi:hypothetical protein
MTMRAQGEVVQQIGAGRGAFSAKLRRALSALPEDARAALSGAAFGGFGLAGSVCVATGLGAETTTVRVLSFLGFVVFAWAAVLVGEVVFTQRRDRLAIEREGLYLSHLGGRYFAPWRELGRFREVAGVVLIEDHRLRPNSWGTLFAPIALDPAMHEFATAAQMCDELNAARTAALREDAP